MSIQSKGIMGFNPFETGLGLSTVEDLAEIFEFEGFNPFETGLGLSTYGVSGRISYSDCFNPFETGLGLSTAEWLEDSNHEFLFQSL